MKEEKPSLQQGRRLGPTCKIVPLPPFAHRHNTHTHTQEIKYSVLVKLKDNNGTYWLIF